MAIPGKLVEILDQNLLTRTGKVSFGGILKEVNRGYVPEVRLGDDVTVHVGFALSILDEEEAECVFEYLQEIDSIEELE